QKKPTHYKPGVVAFGSSISVILMASTETISGTAFLMACSKPALKVMILIEQLAQAPSNLSFTTLSAVISSTLTLPPSVSKYGRIVSNACSTLSRKFISFVSLLICKYNQFYALNKIRQY